MPKFNIEVAQLFEWSEMIEAESEDEAIEAFKEEVLPSMDVLQKYDTDEASASVVVTLVE